MGLIGEKWGRQYHYHQMDFEPDPPGRGDNHPPGPRHPEGGAAAAGNRRGAGRMLFSTTPPPPTLDLILSRIYQGWDSALYQR